MTHAEQFEFDWQTAEAERPFMEQYARNEKDQADQFTEESLCIAWVTESDGRAWRDWWQALPSYARRQMLNCYRAERAAAVNSGMRPYRTFVPSREELQAHESLVQRIEQEIRQAAIDRRPIPFRESPDSSPIQRLIFRGQIEEAMRRANVVIIAAQA